MSWLRNKHKSFYPEETISVFEMVFKQRWFVWKPNLFWFKNGFFPNMLQSAHFQVYDKSKLSNAWKLKERIFHDRNNWKWNSAAEIYILNFILDEKKVRIWNQITEELIHFTSNIILTSCEGRKQTQKEGDSVWKTKNTIRSRIKCKSFWHFEIQANHPLVI